MNKLFHNQKYLQWLRVFRPWVTVLIVFLVLRFTGAMSYISSVAGTAIMATGAMDASPKNDDGGDKSFNYNFTMRDMNGNVVHAHDFKNKTIFLNLWATWCGPCRMEMPSIQKLYSHVDHDKIVFIMLSLDASENDQKVKDFVSKNGFSFPIYRPEGSLPNQLNVPSIPTTFIVSPDGKVVSKKVGAANYDNDEFKNFIEGLVATPSEH